MTVHKSQAATMDRVVIDLRGDVFEHGQLYVAISRVRSANDVAVLLRPGQTHIKNVTLEIQHSQRNAFEPQCILFCLAFYHNHKETQNQYPTRCFP